MVDEQSIQAEGIILVTHDFGDAHRVVTLFTKEYGKLDVNAYGCRRPRSKLAGAMMMFNHVKVELLRGPKVDMVREAEILNFFPITDDLFRLAYASLFFEIVNKMTPLNQKDEDIFFLLLDALKTFVERNPRVVCLIATCQFIGISGEELQLDRCIRCGRAIESDCLIDLFKGGALCDQCSEIAAQPLRLTSTTRELIETSLAFDWKNESHLTIRAENLSALENLMLAHVQSLIEQPLRSLKFLRQLFALAPPS